MGLDIQSSGTVEQVGKDISALPPLERDFGIVFQFYALFPNLTSERNIAFGLENQKVSKADVSKRVADLLELVSLPDVSAQITQSVIPIGAVLFIAAEIMCLPELLREAREGIKTGEGPEAFEP